MTGGREWGDVEEQSSQHLGTGLQGGVGVGDNCRVSGLATRRAEDHNYSGGLVDPTARAGRAPTSLGGRLPHTGHRPVLEGSLQGPGDVPLRGRSAVIRAAGSFQRLASARQ